MAKEILNIHSETPEMRKVKMAADALKDGAVILYPTDSGFSLGCDLSNKDAIDKIRLIRRLSKDHQLTFLCRDLANISEFAKVDNVAYRTVKALIPGPYTFILPASKNVPHFAYNPKRSTTGIRVPNNQLVQLLLQEVGNPILAITAKNEDNTLRTPEEIIDFFGKQVDLTVTSDAYEFVGDSSVIDMTEQEFKVIRKAAGGEKLDEMLYTEEA
jgi:tRNA threonylcarbamoyl adenosine modification protein (Sua5/YciO/YrdC/YwlC family)